MTDRTTRCRCPQACLSVLVAALAGVVGLGLGTAEAQPAPDFTLAAAPTAPSFCQGQDATINVTVGSISGYTEPVTLNAVGAPGGTTTGFSVNPVVAPGASVLTIGNTSNALGVYVMDIVGVAPTSTHTTTVTLQFIDCRIPLASPSGLAAVAALMLLIGAGLLYRRG